MLKLQFMWPRKFNRLAALGLVLFSERRLWPISMASLFASLGMTSSLCLPYMLGMKTWLKFQTQFTAEEYT